jgi:hypothetical protein
MGGRSVGVGGLFPIETKVSQLWNSLGDDAEDKYSDGWLKPTFGELNPELGFLAVLSWGPHKVERQLAVWKKVKAKYEEIGVPLHKMSSQQTEALVDCYPLKKGWQGKFLRGMALYLRNTGKSLDEVAGALREGGSGFARAVLQDIFGTTSTKVVDCYLRDILLLDAFPIDSRVRKVLAKYSIPPDPAAIVAVCNKMGIDVRILARATYSWDVE